MAEFINTIEVLGDDAVVDSIIERTITEFKDNELTEVGQYAFYNCTALETVDLPNAESVGQYSFYGCSALERLDFPALTSIQGFALAECSALTTLILRNTAGVVTLAASGLEHNTDKHFSDGTGFIYVPKALVDSYKAATNWSAYASQIRAIEDYPDICGG